MKERAGRKEESECPNESDPHDCPIDDNLNVLMLSAMNIGGDGGGGESTVQFEQSVAQQCTVLVSHHHHH